MAMPLVLPFPWGTVPAVVLYIVFILTGVSESGVEKATPPVSTAMPTVVVEDRCHNHDPHLDGSITTRRRCNEDTTTVRGDGS